MEMTFEAEVSPPEGPHCSEKQVKAVLVKHSRNVCRVLLTRGCHRTIDTLIRQLVALLTLTQREARRKKRSKEWLRFRRILVANVAKAPLGHLSQLTSDQLDTLDQVFAAMVLSLRGGNPVPGSLEASAFLSLQKRVLTVPKRRGPRNLSKYDEAFLRYIHGEEVTSIARAMDPKAFDDDTVNTIQKYWRAIERRKRQALRP